MSEVEALRAALESRDAQLDRQNAGLVQMARERDALRAKLTETTALHGIAEARERRLERELLAIWAAVRTGDSAPLTEGDVKHAVEDVRRERDALLAEVARLQAENDALRAIIESGGSR